MHSPGFSPLVRISESMKLVVQKAWPVLLLLALVLVFFGDVWFGGRMLLMRDFLFGDVPIRIQQGEALRHGSFGLWQTIQCGAPGAAQPYTAAFYPPNWIFALPSVEGAIRLWWMFHLAVSALGWYALARSWRLAIAPALFAAVCFTFSTQLITWMEGAQAFTGMVWGPLVLLLVGRLIERTAEMADLGIQAVLLRNAGWVAALAGVAALQLLANGEYCYYTALIAGAYGVTQWLRLRSWKVCGYSALLFLLAGGLGLAMALPQLVLMSELLPLSDRGGEYNAFLDLASVHPRHWLTILLPFLYGKPGYPNAYWGPKMHEFAAGHCYVGMAPLVAAGFGWLWCKGAQASGERRFQVGFFALLGVTGLVMAAGKFTPVYPFLHHWLPGLGHLRFAPKFYLFVAYALTALGALGFQALIESDGMGNRVRLWWIAAGCFGVLLSGYVLCLLADGFLPWLMAHPGTPSAGQVNDAMFDYTWAVGFAGAALGLFGLLAFRRGPVRWVQGGIVALAFVNLLVISRQVQPTTASGIYTQKPEALAKETGKHPTDRFLSIYSGAQQYFYGETRREMYEWAITTGATNATRLAGMSILTPGGVALERYNQLFGFLMSAPPPVSDKIADMMSLRYVVVGAPFDQILWGNAPREGRMIERPNCLPRAILVSRWRWIAEDGAVLRTLVSDGFDPRREAILEPLPGEQTPPSGTEEAQGGEVRSFADHTDSVAVEVTTTGRSLLVVSDTWYPGWTATVDGAPRPIYRANYHFRGVFLEPGTHHVAFVYRPQRLALGAWICALAVAACGALAWMGRSAEASARNRGAECRVTPRDPAVS